MAGKPFVVGIAGGSGSGKTTLVQQLRALVPPAALAVIEHDAYYRANQTNYDHPDSLENELLVAHLDKLLAGHAIDRPDYDYTTHARRPTTVRVEPRPVLLVEGILLFAIPELRERIDLRVFVDAPAEERLVRRILRDQTPERNRTFDSILAQFRATVRPMHEAFVEPSRAHAHLVVPCGHGSDLGPALEVLLARIEAAMRDNPLLPANDDPGE